MTRRLSSDTGPFALVPLWVLRLPSLGAHAIRVYALLSQRADNDSDAATVARADLAEACYASLDTVDRAVRQLIDAGALERIVVNGPEGRLPNRYVVHRADPDRAVDNTSPGRKSAAGAQAAGTTSPGRTGAAASTTRPSTRPPVVPTSSSSTGEAPRPRHEQFVPDADPMDVKGATRARELRAAMADKRLSVDSAHDSASV